MIEVFKCMRLFQLTLIAALWLHSGTSLAQSGKLAMPKHGCVRVLQGLPAKGQEFGLEEASKITDRMMGIAKTGGNISVHEVQDFMQNGWPVLERFAQEAGKTVPELFIESQKLFAFINETVLSKEAARKGESKTEVIVNSVKWLSQKKPGTALKPYDYPPAALVMATLKGMALLAMQGEIIFYDRTTLNPLLPLDKDQVENIMQTFGDVAEETALRYVLTYEALKAERTQEAQSGPGATIQTDKPTAVAQVETFSQANKTVKKEKVDQAIPLRELLESKEFVEGQIYVFKNLTGEEYTMHFDSEVAKEAAKGEMPNIVRLLSSVYLGDGTRSGIKMLTTVGKNVVEIKAIMRGHKRLIGCLKGRHLHIRRFYNIPENMAAYSHRIPPNFCE